MDFLNLINKNTHINLIIKNTQKTTTIFIIDNKSNHILSLITKQNHNNVSVYQFGGL